MARFIATVIVSGAVSIPMRIYVFGGSPHAAVDTAHAMVFGMFWGAWLWSKEGK